MENLHPSKSPLQAALFAAATTREAALSTASPAFRGPVAATVGVTGWSACFKASGKRHGNLTVSVAMPLGRTLTATEGTAPHAAVPTRNAAPAAAVTAFCAAVAAATGLWGADLDAAFFAAASTRSRGGRGGGRH